MTLQGIIFDCDGLLIDTETPEFVSWQEVFQSHGTTLSLEVWQAGIGSAFSFDIYDMLAEQSGRAVDKAAIRAARRPRHDQMILEGGLLPGVLSTIQTARQMNLKLAVGPSAIGHPPFQSRKDRCGPARFSPAMVFNTARASSRFARSDTASPMHRDSLSDGPIVIWSNSP